MESNRTQLSGQIKMISGYHLTAGNRRAIRAVIDSGHANAKVGRTIYRISPTDKVGRYNVEITFREINFFGVMDDRVNQYVVEYKSPALAGVGETLLGM